jgi:hypoxanthine phosphoribosyltransferase
MGPHLVSLIDESRIAAKIEEIASLLNKEYAGKELVIVMVLKGAICLVADLIRKLDLPFELAHVQCSSYGSRGTERGELQILGIDRLNLQHRDVLIVDDIFDSGHTLSTLVKMLQKQKPRCIKSLVLLSKNVPHLTDYRPDYILFSIEDLFVVGYGLDYQEKYRGLSGIFVYMIK